MLFSHKTFTHKGVTVSYCEAGSGETFIFLPGWGARPRTYQKALEILAEKYHVVSPELPGFSSYPDPKDVWNLGDYAKFFRVFIDSLDCDSYLLAGHSLGGGIALYIATHQKKIKKLFLIDAFGLPIEHSRFRLYFLYMFRLVREMISYRNITVHLRIYRELLANMLHLSYIVPFTFKIFDRKIATDTSVFQNVTTPTIILWGKEDTIFGRKTVKDLHAHLPQSELHFLKGSHNWILFHPELLSTYL